VCLYVFVVVGFVNRISMVLREPFFHTLVVNFVFFFLMSILFCQFIVCSRLMDGFLLCSFARFSSLPVF